MENNNETCCIGRILKVIEVLQNNANCETSCEEGCSKPFLGPTVLQNVYNTRPINLYTENGDLLTINYGDNKTSSVFRVECVNGCCAKLRLLGDNTTTKDTTTYTNTGEFITVNLKKMSIVSCLNDIELNI